MFFCCHFQQPPVEEPASGGKEKRKRKLDEIVLGLSAAKEQKTFSDPLLSSPSLKKQIPPSVSVTPATGPNQASSSNQTSQKPFSITVTSVPGSGSRKSIDFSVIHERLLRFVFFIDRLKRITSIELWLGCTAKYGNARLWQYFEWLIKSWTWLTRRPWLIERQSKCTLLAIGFGRHASIHQTAREIASTSAGQFGAAQDVRSHFG